jgi:hypothetical protein
VRKFALILAIFAPVFVASAQISVRISVPQDDFLVYEPITIIVEISSFAGRTIVLRDTAEQPWLSLDVKDASERVVRAINVVTNETVELRPQQTIRRTINLTPLFEIRTPNVYRVQAIVTESHSSRQFASSWRPIEVVHGVKIWEQTIGLPAEHADAEEYRTYTLLTQRRGRDNHLYLRVQDERGGLVYGMFRLGKVLLGYKPQARCDVEGNGHVLHQIAPRYFQHTAVGPMGNVLERAIYSDFVSSPRLMTFSDGRVMVDGGEKVHPADASGAPPLR